jgi:hypothetical protein
VDQRTCNVKGFPFEGFSSNLFQMLHIILIPSELQANTSQNMSRNSVAVSLLILEMASPCPYLRPFPNISVVAYGVVQLHHKEA